MTVNESALIEQYKAFRAEQTFFRNTLTTLLLFLVTSSCTIFGIALETNNSSIILLCYVILLPIESSIYNNRNLFNFATAFLITYIHPSLGLQSTPQNILGETRLQKILHNTHFYIGSSIASAAFTLFFLLGGLSFESVRQGAMSIFVIISTGLVFFLDSTNTFGNKKRMKRYIELISQECKTVDDTQSVVQAEEKSSTAI